MKLSLTPISATILGLILLPITPGGSFAQATAFTYQGRLEDVAAPANGNYDLAFALYDAASGGTQQGLALTNAATSVSNGLFTVTLDFGNQFPGAARWLELAVSTNGANVFSTLSPRQRLTATPYAIYAGNASNLLGTVTAGNIAAGSISSVMLATGAVGSNQLAAGAVTTEALANGAVTSAKVASVSNWFAFTIANPTPANYDRFGYSLAAVGSDRVLIGADRDDTGAFNAGVAYLFSTNGTLLTTFTNPTPAGLDYFGNSLAALGSDRVLIGADGDSTGAAIAGVAYLFSTNGTLLTTFTNPTPATYDYFGYSLATLGSDRVLIGAYGDDTGAEDGGAAYLFSTNGTLLTTFTNPTPTDYDWFGNSLAAVGSDRVLIGAYRDDTGALDTGAAYLFSAASSVPGLIAESVQPRSINTFSLADGAVTAVKISGVLFPAQIPDLDASQITSGTLAATQIPNLDAAKIASGIFASSRIPNLDAAKITTGIFAATQIPNLDASKITSGDFADARLSANVALLNTAQTFTADKTFSAGAQLLADGGSATAPGIAFSGDADSGLWRPAANTLALTTDGTTRLHVGSGGHVAIGIPEGSADAALHIQNTVGSRPIKCDRLATDGQLIAFAKDDTVVGDISVAAGVVSYNAFTGSHYAWLPQRLERGALVTLTGTNRRSRNAGEIVYGVAPTARANDPACLGAYLAPHQTDDKSPVADQHQIMSVGNGEMWVVEGGAGDLRPGDFLISSDVAGCAMKDQPERFPVGYICARAAEGVQWSDVKAGADGVKRVRISVLFESFARHSNSAALAATVKEQQAEIESLKTELQSLRALKEQVASIESFLQQRDRSLVQMTQQSGGAK